MFSEGMVNIKILDCTLRDGGYYNKWDFSEEVFQQYLTAMASANIDYVELGLRSFPKEGFYGAFAYTTEVFLNRVSLPDGPVYGVMVDAKTILNSSLSIVDAIDCLFVDARHSKIGLVRIAAHFAEVESSGEIAQLLKKKGYVVGFNLMQAGGKPDELITEKAALIDRWGCLDVLYFADSLGNMDAREVSRIYSALRREWDGDIGIHTHNNMSKALENTFVAEGLGVKWLDATVSGMGRGAGNAQIENVLALVSQRCTAYNPAPVYELVIRHFEPMKKEFGWGPGLLYFLGAQSDVHPTYIQNLLSNSHYGTDEIVGAINYLSKFDGSTSYSGDVLDAALSFCSTDTVSGCDELVGVFNGREMLIVANGPSIETYLEEIKVYIRERKPVVVAINHNMTLPPEYIDFYCISHNSKFLAEGDLYKDLKKPIILPQHRFTLQELDSLSNNKLIDYGLEVDPLNLDVGDTSCRVPFDVTSAYALSISVVSNASAISVVGFDGYALGDERQMEMVDIFNLFRLLEGVPTVTALTPTSYPILQGSIYAPAF